MGKRKRRRFTPQQKAQAVEMATTSGKSLTEVARDLDLTPSALGNWVRQAGIDMKKNPKGALTTSEREELAQLRRDKKRLEQENAFRDIVKSCGWSLFGQHDQAALSSSRSC